MALNEIIYLETDPVQGVLKGEAASPDDEEPASDDDGHFVQTSGPFDEVPASMSGAEAFGGYTREVPEIYD